MFLDELSPFVKELVSHPAAFFGGFVSGMLRLNLAEDPVKQWLDQQVGSASVDQRNQENGSGRGPTTINID